MDLGMPWTFRYLLDTLDLKVPLGYLGPIGSFRIPWTFRYLIDALDLLIPLNTLELKVQFYIPKTFG